MRKTIHIQLALLRLIRNIQQRRLILVLSLIIGLLSGIAAILLKNLTHTVEQRAKALLLGESSANISYIFPLLGITITVIFVSYILKQDIGHGISKILYSFSRRKGHLKPHNTWSSMIASSITVGFGGSVGLEAPIVLTGASIGSNLGHLLRLNYRTIVLLVGCGAAGAIAGIKNLYFHDLKLTFCSNLILYPSLLGSFNAIHTDLTVP